jgi:predicted O-methyltransferase YrrM
MILPWVEKRLAGVTFLSSITEAESSRLAKLARGKFVLEIGTAFGYSACVMAREDATSVLTVDPHEGYGSMYGSLPTARANIRSTEVDDRVILIIGESVDVVPQFSRAGVEFDLVFIDGDHRFDACSVDLALSWAVLAPGGWIAVHDVGEDTCPDVSRAVHRFSDVNSLPESFLIDTLWTCQKR